MTSLEYNIQNMRMGHFKKGSDKWLKRATKVVQKLNYDELSDLDVRRGKPWFLQDSGPVLRGLWKARKSGVPKGKARRASDRFSGRALKAMRKIHECSLGNVGYATVVTSISLTKEQALQAVQTDGQSVSRFIRNRFPHAIWIMFPEVEQVLVEDVADDLLLDRSWREGMADKAVCYKVHFHGMIYVPGGVPRSIELGFHTHRSGKRISRFSGVNQVRVLPMYADPDEKDVRPDVIGVAGYSTKKHYRPPTDERMLEGYAEWVWLTDKIASNPNLVITGGVNGPIKDYCSSCHSFFPIDDTCQCGPLCEVDDFYGFQQISNECPSTSVHQEQVEKLPSDGHSFLNWIGLSHYDEYPILHGVKKMVARVARPVFAGVAWLTGQIRGP